MLQKRQQEAAKRHREYEQRMSREIQVRLLECARRQPAQLKYEPLSFVFMFSQHLLVCGSCKQLRPS